MTSLFPSIVRCSSPRQKIYLLTSAKYTHHRTPLTMATTSSTKPLVAGAMSPAPRLQTRGASTMVSTCLFVQACMSFHEWERRYRIVVTQSASFGRQSDQSSIYHILYEMKCSSKSSTPILLWFKSPSVHHGWSPKHVADSAGQAIIARLLTTIYVLIRWIRGLQRSSLPTTSNSAAAPKFFWTMNSDNHMLSAELPTASHIPAQRIYDLDAGGPHARLV